MKSSKPRADNAVRPAALRLLARREHSVLELKRKLLRGGHADSEVERVVNGLVAERLLDDERFAEMYVRSHVSRGAGPVKIRHGLAEHGLSDAMVAEVLAGFDGQWVELAARARRKRFGTALPLDAKDRARQTRFLSYRGFTPTQIRGALSIKGSSDEYGDAGQEIRQRR